MINEGLQYGFGVLYWRTKPRGVRNDFFCIFFKNFYKTKDLTGSLKREFESKGYLTIWIKTRTSRVKF